MKYSLEVFIKKVEEKYSEPFEIIEYEGTAKPGKFRCGYCKQEYSLVKMGKLLNKERLHVCTHCFASKYAAEVLKVVSEEPELDFVKFGYKQNIHKPTVCYKCIRCNELTEKPYTEFLKYPTCIHCGNNAKRKTTSGIVLEIPDDFTLLEPYNGQYNKVLFRHSCGFIFSVRPKDLITGHSYCPKCSKKASKGERKIMSFLEFNQIDFIKEKIFDWSDNKRYDFFLPKFNLLIEYNGVQHYKEIPNFSLPLEKQQAIDKWKENKAKEVGFDVLVISYLDFDNIENILAQRLKENA